MNLSKATLNELFYRLGVCEEEPELAEVIPELLSVLDAGTVEALAASSVTQDELENMLHMQEGRELSAMIRDLCLAGYFPVHEGAPAMGHTPKTRTVNGVKYSVGY